ncbi:4'-phosphopantetheinyl transferase family protein [Shewanella sp. TC10]|uniref:4'-phosphopantetheinyl transferase family protein n=1 Tax=Shewanella sp. TC10 TaxID=1419739 RepID=UPI001E591F94|nr:4'-phosphopantetheinyl transferase superfamily protein [Shewanella sp. TC10]
MNPSTAIQLFFCPLNTDLLDESSASIVRSWLPEDEVKKVDRFIQQSSREQGLMVRGYLRSVLSHFASVEPDEWQFEYGEKGKPKLTAAQFAQTGLHFNLSHSGDWLLIGVVNTNGAAQQQTEIELGVDIERRRETTNIHSILNHYFSKPEEAALLALPEKQQRERFFDLWSLKESYIKAKGLGLALSLKSFAFELNNLQFHSVPVTYQCLLNTQTLPKELCLSDKIPLGLRCEDEQCEAEQTEYVTTSNWQCYLGRIDQVYRFAISLDCGVENQVDVIAKEVSWIDLINTSISTNINN